MGPKDRESVPLHYLEIIYPFPFAWKRLSMFVVVSLRYVAKLLMLLLQILSRNKVAVYLFARV